MNQQPLNINNQLPLINTQQPLGNIQPTLNILPQQPLVNTPKPTINEILTDPRYHSTRDAEILKTFELAKLTRDEAVLVLDKINGHQALQIALEKLKPFIHT